MISCSWGPADGDWWDPNDPLHKQVVPLPRQHAPRHRLRRPRNGRGGKGCVVLFAAGNGNECVDNDGYASYAKVTAVAACNDRGTRSVYSDFGKAVWCALPEQRLRPRAARPSRAADAGHLDDRPQRHRPATTPARIAEGDAAGQLHQQLRRHLERLPGRGRRRGADPVGQPGAASGEEVKDMLKRACDGSIRRAASTMATGHSAFYGYGRLNARKAVELALPAVPQEAVVVARVFDEPILDLRASRVQLVIGETALVEDIRVSIDIAHTWIGDLVVSLAPPPKWASPRRTARPCRRLRA